MNRTRRLGAEQVKLWVATLSCQVVTDREVGVLTEAAVSWTSRHDRFWLASSRNMIFTQHLRACEHIPKLYTRHRAQRRVGDITESETIERMHFCATESNSECPSRIPISQRQSSIPQSNSNYLTSSRALHLVVALYRLRISRRDIRAGARRLSRRRRRRANKAVLVAGELRVRRAAVHGAVSLLARALAAGCVLRLALHVIVGHAALLFVADLLVGGVGCDCDDVPGVEKAGEEAEHWAVCQIQSNRFP